ncbi:Scr1 family TA system antitoxin-like transcriptional regulator [Micromonospora tulbaghiae]|uniref:Scr1 family TA system antitoxin-like transcriptional regulator n=1 Tax=Micromonospora tulbaghiae TaxID=479978 RepID=UPI001CEFAD0A
MGGRCRTDGNPSGHLRGSGKRHQDDTEFAISLIPGLLQSPAYAAARLRSEPVRHADGFDPAPAVAARARRQSLVLVAGGPRYEAVIGESAIRRRAADPVVVAEQLRHVIARCTNHPSSVAVQVLPSDASITSHSAPPAGVLDLPLSRPAEVTACRGRHPDRRHVSHRSR